MGHVINVLEYHSFLFVYVLVFCLSTYKISLGFLKTLFLYIVHV